MKRLTLAALVCLTICSCINEDEIITSATALAPADQLYLTIRLSDSSASTRATDGDFEYGTSDEYAVTDGRFYFYDEDGVFISRASVWNNQGTVSDETSTNTSVEYTSGTMIVLKGLTNKNFPKYMVTVLNEPDGFEGTNYQPTNGATLGELATMLASTSTTGIYDGTSSHNFVMSTSSYLDTGDTASRTIDDSTYFVTELSEENFAVEPVISGTGYQDNGDEAKPVQVYVDRLAVKVTVEDQSTRQTGFETIENADGTTSYYHLVSDVSLTNESGTSEEALYINLLGCNLNATARRSYMFKQLADSWSFEDSWSKWNDEDNHRSYWGKGYAYGVDTTFPEKNYYMNDAEKEASSTSWLNDYLEYHDLTAGNITGFTYSSDGSTTTGTTDPMYCAENTNTAAALTQTSAEQGSAGDDDDDVEESLISSAVTAVLVKAQVGTISGDGDNQTFTPTSFVTYNGGYYTPAACLSSIAQSIDGLSQYYYEIGDTQEFELISPETLIDFENLGDGYVSVTAVSKITVNGNQYDNYYTFDGRDYNTIDESDILSAVSDACSTWQTAHAGEYLNYYNDGMMYYSIPLEHLNSIETGATTIEEANYGVVRNHHYNLVLTSVSHLGKGIYDESEVIVPNEHEDTSLYITATTQFLPWKVYEQHVTVF